VLIHTNIEPNDAASILADYGVTFRPGPAGTSIEGDWELAMTAIEACHRAALQRGPVVTTVVFDEAI